VRDEGYKKGGVEEKSAEQECGEEKRAEAAA
jgi:hypothetical protein